MSNLTPLPEIYGRFLPKVTEDLYLELTKEDTMRDMEAILLSAIPSFEFPRFALYDYNLDYEEYDDDTMQMEKVGAYNPLLTLEEKDILSDLMAIEWLNRQVISIDNIRMKYSGSDFRFTSQANHLDKLLKMKTQFELSCRRKQRMYKRRKINGDGSIATNYAGLAGGVID